MDKIKLSCAHADTCLPGFWGGHHLPHISIPVFAGMTLDKIKRSLLSELLDGAIAGSFDFQIVDSEEWYNAASDAVNNITPIDGKIDDSFFDDIESNPEIDNEETVYAYFVFIED